MQQFLEHSEYIDCRHPSIREQAAKLAAGCNGEVEIARSCFEFVCEQIQHSWDHQRNPVTCKASDVLKHGTGYCYAKSHLLAALLRANRIPAGLCYQRLTLEPGGATYCLHGLNGVYLQEFGWYRADPRGRKPGVNPQFTPPHEQLAFTIQYPGEADLPGIWPEPLSEVIEVLQHSRTYLEVYQNLPDLEVFPLPAKQD